MALGLIPALLSLLRGGYFSGTWLTLAVLTGALLLVLRVGGGARLAGFRGQMPLRAQIPLALLVALAGWTLGSALWATDAAAALSEGTRTILYVLLAAFAFSVVRNHDDARLFMIVYSLGAGAVALATVAAAALSASPDNYFRYFKLNEPVGYYNAEATFFLMPALLAIHLASRRSTTPILRPLLFSAAVASLQVAVLTQSRGAFWAFLAALLIYFVIVPGRPRALLWWATALGLLTMSFDELNGPHLVLRDYDLQALPPSVRIAAAAVAIAFVVALTAATILTVADLRIRLRSRGVRASQGVAVAVLAAGIVLGIVRFPALLDPVDAVRGAWEQFKGTPTSASNVRILDLSGNQRYELWQVAWRTFEDSPALGIGADNYSIAWNMNRSSPHDVRQPHNLYLRLLAELGLPGLLLLVAAGAATLVASLRSLAGSTRKYRGPVVAGLVAACTQFLVHAAGEWVWHIPAVGSGFFLLVGTLLGVSAGEGGPAGSAPLTRGREPCVADPPKRRGPSPLTLLAVTGTVLVALAAPQLVSERFTARGTSLLTQSEPQLARQAAVWAARANPLSGKPYMLEARAWAAENEYAKAQSAFLAATERNPADWHAYMIWGDTVAAGGGDPRMLYETARALNPRSFGVRDRLKVETPVELPVDPS
ncbi:MAG: O-antigen ligase family protein [Actinobacteria bacterium]|nr:O-antigen ligase family protein [Actinomycetota bacterium]